MIKKITLCGKQYEYTLVRKNNIKNINLRIKQDGSIYVSSPKRVPLRFIEDFVVSNEVRIASAVARMKENAPKPSENGIPKTVTVSGRAIPVTLTSGTQNRAYTDGDVLIVCVRDTGDVSAVNKTVEKWLDGVCRETVGELCGKIYPLFSDYGFRFPEIRYRKMKSRWGSCLTKRGVIIFNKSLATVPVACAEYVVLHEFSHLVEPNHSKAFYAVVSRFMPDWKERKKLLNSFSAKQ